MILHIKGAIFRADEISGARVYMNTDKKGIDKWGVVVHLRDQSPAFVECESEEAALDAMNAFEERWQQYLANQNSFMEQMISICNDTLLRCHATENSVALMQKDLAGINKAMKGIQKEFKEVDVLPVPIKYDPERILEIKQG